MVDDIRARENVRDDMGTGPADDGVSEEAQRSGGTRRNAGAGASDRNTNAEPPPALSEKGGIVPQQEDPSQYNDRARDRDLNE